MRYLGLDLGTHRLGVSLSTLDMAVPLMSIEHENNYDYLIDEIRKLVESKNIDMVVLGLPKNMNNSLGNKGIDAIEFGDRIKNEIGVDVVMQDERLSTVSATNMLIDRDMRREKRKDVVDNIAATIILQCYLDRRKNER